MERLSALLVWRINGPNRASPPRADAKTTDPDSDARSSAAAERLAASFRSRPIGWMIIVGLIAAALVWLTGHRKSGLDRGPGQVLPGFELVDARSGQINRASDYSGELLVIVFVGTSCPVGDLYMPRLFELAQTV